MQLMEATKLYKPLTRFTFDKKAEIWGNDNETTDILNIKSESEKDNVIVNIEKRSVVSSFKIVASGVT